MDKKRLYVYLSPLVEGRLSELAKEYGMSKSGMASMFITSGIRVFKEKKVVEEEKDRERWNKAVKEAMDVEG